MKRPIGYVLPAMVLAAAMLAAPACTGPKAGERGAPGGGSRLLETAIGSPVPIAASALAAGDVNGDRCADLVLCEGTTLKVIFGSGTRAWPKVPDVTSELADKSSELVLADLNHDSKLDAVIAHHDSYSVTVLLGSGDGRFQRVAASPFAARDGTQPHTHGLAVADVNGDGRPDIVTANNDDGDVSLLLGDGSGRFSRAPHSPFSCGKRPYPIAASDINGDGYADILVPNTAPSDLQLKTLTVLLGNARSELAPAPHSPFQCDASVWYVATGDLNNDRQPDVVATHTEGGAGVTILLNAGQGRLVPAPGSPLKLNHGAWGVEVADMNRDGKPDLVIAAAESIQVFQGDGRGGFQPAPGSPYATGKGAWRLSVADFNGDGKLDVATNCVEANHLEILLGR